MYLKQNPKLKFPKRAMAKAEKICRDFSLFERAADALREAIDSKNARREIHWRNVFGAFSRLAFRLSNSIESGPRIGVQKVPLLAGRNDSACPRRSWSGLRSRGERGGVGGGFER